MKNILTNTTKSAYKGIVFWTFFWLTVFSVAYAASITSTTQTVTSWDSITANWYQEVNNKIGGISVGNWKLSIQWDQALIWNTQRLEIHNSTTNPTKWISIWLWDGNSLRYETVWWEAKFISYWDYPMTFGTNSWEKMRIDSSGNIWIGTSSPSHKLQVNGRIISTGSNIWVTNWWTPYGQSIYSPAANELGISTNSTERIRINSNGNIWIWTSIPSSQSNSSYRQINLPEYSSINALWGNALLGLHQNSYVGTGNDSYYWANGNAALYYAYNGTHSFKVANSWTKDNKISWNDAMNIKQNGNVWIGDNKSLKIIRC